jgi:hypothetical protein
MKSCRGSQKRELALNCTDTETQTMALPDGKSCGDCIYFSTCNRLIGLSSENEICDFYPNRFTDSETRR